jgi:hypothetical protein
VQFLPTKIYKREIQISELHFPRPRERRRLSFKDEKEMDEEEPLVVEFEQRFSQLAHRKLRWEDARNTSRRINDHKSQSKREVLTGRRYQSDS